MFLDRKYLLIFLVLAVIVSVGVVSATDFNDDNCFNVDILQNNPFGNDSLELGGHVSVAFKIDGYYRDNVHVKIIDKKNNKVLVDEYTDQFGEVDWFGLPFESYDCRAHVYYNNKVYIADFSISPTSNHEDININTNEKPILKITPEKQIVKTEDSVKFNGILTKGNKPISNALINVTHNGDHQVVKTDANGHFSYTYIENENNGYSYTDFAYQAYDGYIANTNSHVKIENNYELNVDSEVSTKVGQPASIVGSLLCNGQPVPYATVNFVINNHYETVQTDANGHFVYTFTPEEASDMNVTFYYMTYHGSFHEYDVCHVKTAL